MVVACSCGAPKDITVVGVGGGRGGDGRRVRVCGLIGVEAEFG